MNSELIETFITVAKLNNITKTAQLLYVSQATVSHRIKQLEDLLGFPLLIRQKGIKQTQLTIAGKKFLPLAQSWLKLNYEINTFNSYPKSIELTIGLVNSANNFLFTDFYNQLKDDDIDWRLRIKTMHTPEIYNEIKLNIIDIGFPLAELIFPEINVKKIHTEKLMIISKHKIKNKSILTPNDLDMQNQIYINWGWNYQLWHNRCFSSNITPKFAVDSAIVALSLLDDKAWFFAPYSICMNFEVNYNCYISKLALNTPSRTLYMITNKQTEQLKRKQLILFKRRLLRYIYSHEQSIQDMLNKVS